MRRAHRDDQQPPERADLAAAVEEVVNRAVRVGADGLAFYARTLTTHAEADPRTVERTLTARLLREVTTAWQHGWQPAELVRHVSREAGARPSRLATDLVAAEMRGYAAATVDDAWQSQLTAMDAQVWWDGDDTCLQAWRTREGVDQQTLMTTVLRVAAVLAYHPRLRTLLPPPGTARRTSSNRPADAPPVPERMLGRVRALLAKAESTEFAEEAEALTARAQELMARHSIDHALLAAETGTTGEPAARRLAVDTPYESQKTLLLHEIAAANRCKSIWHKNLGLCTVLGFPADIDAVDLLFTSLLVQATTALVQAGSHQDTHGRSRTRSFRQSFLIAYAYRIGERLAAATGEAQQNAAAESPGTDLLPVLAARDKAVDAVVEEMFPQLTRGSMGSANDYEGWIAGQAAADRAALQARPAVT
jgi:Protein of unknown function (DUF2786)